jgi:glycosyltransferase involved in cell wall biosynthesis
LPYILGVATLYRYKNVARLLEAFARLKTEDRVPHRLRVVGGEADVTFVELAEHASSLGIADQVDLVGPLPHQVIAAEYAGASVFAYVSLEETFGLPPLEAMSLGVPVVASRVSSIPEVVGEAAEMVDPLDVGDIARGLRRVLFEPGRSAELRLLGLERTRHFSWDNSARQTVQALRSALA